MEVALPEDGGYIDGSFKLSSDTLKMFADMPGEEGSAQAGTVQMEAAECCPYCEGENVFPNWDTAKQGYIAKCQTCGEQIMLCDECMHAGDNTGRRCDWHEEVHGNKTWGICFRGMTRHQK